MRFINVGTALCLAGVTAPVDAKPKATKQAQTQGAEAQKNGTAEKREMRTRQLGNGSYIRYEVMPGDDEQPPGELVVMHMEAPEVAAAEPQTPEQVQSGADVRTSRRSAQQRRAACEEIRMRLAARLLELRGVQVDPDVALWIQRNLYFAGDGTPALQIVPDQLFFSAMQYDSTARALATEVAHCEAAAQR